MSDPTSSEQSTEQSTGSGQATGGMRSSSLATRSGAALDSGRGTTTIADAVVSKVVALATREISGVAGIGGGASGAIGGVVGRIRGEEHATSGVAVEVGERQAAADVTIRVEYPAPIHQVADAVRDNVIDRVESMTGLEVVEVNISVADLTFPGEEEDDDQQQTSRVE